MAIRCFWPPESSAGRFSAWGESRKRSSGSHPFQGGAAVKAVHVDERQEQVVQSGEMGKEIVGLEHRADGPPIGSQAAIIPGQAMPFEGDAPRDGHVEPGQDAEEGRFPTTRRADEHEGMDVSRGEREFVEHGGRAETLHQTVDDKLHEGWRPRGAFRIRSGNAAPDPGRSRRAEA